MGEERKLLPALLRYWRGKRGLSQLDLALAAGVSARHVSFLETGRAGASEEMLLLLTATLEVPLRDRNTILRAAGFDDAFPEPALDALADSGIARVLNRMMEQQEPYPLIVMHRSYDVRLMNRAARRLIGACIDIESAGSGPLNALSAFFDPEGLRPYVVNWEQTARELLSRLHREVLHMSNDERLGALLDDVLKYPDVPESWRRPDLSRDAPTTVTLGLRVGTTELRFLVTVTSFSAPRNVTIDELRIESYFPIDETSEEACRALAQEG